MHPRGAGVVFMGMAMSLKQPILLIAMVLGSIPVLAQEPQRVIRGTIRDSLGTRVLHAVVQTTGQSRVVSDDSGHFEYRATPKGELRLLVRRLGYAPLELRMNPSGDTTVQVILSRIPRTFDAMVVEASRLSRRLASTGFYERLGQRNKGLGSASFITAEDIEQRNPLRISQALDQLNGIRVQKVGGGYNDFLLRGPNGCPFSVYLNGTRLGRLGGTRVEEVRIDDFIEPSATAGIEIYPRACGAPPQFQLLNGTCGVVVFWTK